MNVMHRDVTASWFSHLQQQICCELEALESLYHPQDPKVFQTKKWERPGGGGGTMAILSGHVFEKAGVNVSTVHGTFSEAFRAHMPGAEDDPRFWASGISIVIHPRSPYVPIIHMNTRHIQTTRAWFGGGIDMTPAIVDPEDTQQFHKALRDVCDGFDKTYYPRFKAWADEYFYIKHRQEPRGVGGIFYDNLEGLNDTFAFTQAVGRAFMPIYAPIVKKHWHTPWGDKEREAQLIKRGRYVEFNLVYDRGTTFGLKTDGFIEAILMSLPPMASWPAPSLDTTQEKRQA